MRRGLVLSLMDAISMMGVACLMSSTCSPLSD
uniref:Uncharacterized protein n=1 Tax=Oryza barthii TaxID=65489 RepID=A0A0D3GN29_9ORYZ